MKRIAIVAVVAVALAGVVIGAIYVGSRVIGGAGLLSTPRDPWTIDSSVHSSVLGRDMAVEAFVPPATCESAALLILFPGLGGDQRGWMEGDIGNGVGADAIAHRLIGAGEIEPVTIVSTVIDSSYGVDSAPADDGYSHGPYGTYVETELLPQLVERYANGRPVYVGGLSMGGYVALRLALSRPSAFAGVAGLSPAFFVHPPADRQWIYDAGGQASLFDLARAGAGDSMSIFLGYGDHDYGWIQTATDRLSGTLAARSKTVAPVIVGGGHETATWRALAEPMLRTLFGLGGRADATRRPCGA